MARPAPLRPAAPSDATPSAPPDDARTRLQAACFAEPWTAAEPKFAPAPLSMAMRARLDVLEQECRDTHPELGPGRFVTPEAIPPDECHYGIGRIYFEERRYVEAARWFQRTATEHEASDMGVFAAQFYLQTLEALESQSTPKRPACRQLRTDAARRFVCAYCPEPGGEDTCALFRRVAEAAGASPAAACSP